MSDLGPTTVDALRLRMSKDVVDRAIQENQQLEKFLITISATMSIAGLGMCLLALSPRLGPLGYYSFGPWLLTAAGMRYLWRIRRERISMRLLEAVLARTETAAEAADALSQIVKTVFKPAINFKR